MTAPPLPCAPARWPRFSALLDDALALPPGQRATWLAALPAADADLHDGLRRVLAADTRPDDAFLQRPRARLAAGRDGAHGGEGNEGTNHRLSDDNTLADGDGPPLHAGQRIGPWQLEAEIGRGGMGVVWRARRADGAYQREVALKLPHAHLLAGAVQQRFRRERDILASLAHPHIARLYDAGLTADGQPWLALELVRGLPITQWARQQRLPLAARLALFDQVLAAVAHAHARLVAHRDLKPANVLVDEQGAVRLLDFGIAKLLHDDDDADADAPLTRAGQRIATPAYAAPEQLAGGTVSVATDVYALGLMLFELLAGQPPFGAQRPPPEADPPLPSTRADAAQAAAAGLALPTLRRALAGDLDAIVSRALQYVPLDRYASVAALAADLDRHRRGLPIDARRLTPLHRAAKFVRRHRSAVALASLLGASIAVGVGGVAWQAQRAEAQARRAAAVTDFLLGVFKASDPRIASDTPRGQISAKALLDASAGRIEARFADDPALQIELLRTVATLYRELGESEAYERLQARHLALARQHLGPLSDPLLQGQLDAAALALARGEHDHCRQLLATADNDLRRAGRDDSALRAAWWTQQAVCLRDRPGQEGARLQALEQALQLFRRLAPRSTGHVTALLERGNEHQHQGRTEAALADFQAALALAASVPDRNDAERLTLHGNIALTHQQAGNLVAAEAAFARAAALAESTSGRQSRQAWVPAAKRARTAHLAGERERADRLFADLMPLLPAAGTDPEAETVREDRGERLAAEGRPLEAIALLEGAERYVRQRPTQDFALRRVRRFLGDAYDRAGRSADAERVFRLALAEFEQQPKASQPVIAMRERWARFLLDRGDLAAAAAQFEQVLAEAGNPAWSHVALAQAGLARIALLRGDAAEAGRRSAQALQTWQQRQGFYDQRMQAALWRVRAAALQAAGQAVEAADLRQRALAAAERSDAPESPTRRDAAYLGL